MGGERIPAGDYTLWSTFTAEEATLIVNSQTGQWGTAYDASQDFAHIPMTSEDLDQPVERFTIAVEPQGSGGVLSLSWDRTRFTVPFTVR
jgi:hypothetical protein